MKVLEAGDCRRSSPVLASRANSRMARLSCRDVLDSHFPAPTVHLGVETDLLAFFQTSDSGTFKCRRVNKDVGTAAIRLDEAEAFLIIEEFYRTRVHVSSFHTGVHEGARKSSACAPIVDRLERVSVACLALQA